MVCCQIGIDYCQMYACFVTDPPIVCGPLPSLRELLHASIEDDCIESDGEAAHPPARPRPAAHHQTFGKQQCSTHDGTRLVLLSHLPPDQKAQMKPKLCFFFTRTLLRIVL